MHLKIRQNCLGKTREKKPCSLAVTGTVSLEASTFGSEGLFGALVPGSRARPTFPAILMVYLYIDGASQYHAHLWTEIYDFICVRH